MSNYWEDTALNLHFNSKEDCSLDATAAAKYKVAANVPDTYVTDLQKDLIALGYLEDKDGNKDGYFGGGAKRAVGRFQPHALRKFRMLADKARVDLADASLWTGRETWWSIPPTPRRCAAGSTRGGWRPRA